MDQYTQLKKAFNKGNFSPEASKLKIACWYITSLLLIRSGLIPFSSILVSILRIYGARIGRDVRIKPRIYIKYPWKLIIEDHSWLADCYIENLTNVTIGKHVCISQKAMLLTGSHDYNKDTFDLITRPIVIEDGVWICANATVCAGVIAHTHAVLTAGSVTRKNLQSFQIYQGNPATLLRKRTVQRG